MKSLLLLPALCCLALATSGQWRFVSKVEELPVEVIDRLNIQRPKVRLCGGALDSSAESSTDCVLCTVCHPNEYELIGCSEQMDSVCASCGTGWSRSTPKTTDFFRKCKKHPILHFPDLPYPLRLDAEPSLFAEQEKMLKHAENNDNTEQDYALSEEEDDYEDDEEEEILRDEEKEEEESKEIGVKPVEVDERDDGSELPPFLHSEDSEENSQEKPSEDSVEFILKEDLISNEEGSIELIDEELADPFRSPIHLKEKKDTEGAPEEDEDEEERIRLYPLHRANIWRIIGPEIAPHDDKDIAKEVRKAINDRMEARQMEVLKRRLTEESQNIIDIANAQRDKQLIGGYRPLIVRTGGSVPYSLLERVNSVPLVVAVAWVLCFSLSCLVMVVMIKVCMLRRRSRVMILPELDDMSRQLINEAHARVHAKKDKKTRPEFV